MMKKSEHEVAEKIRARANFYYWPFDPPHRRIHPLARLKRCRAAHRYSHHSEIAAQSSVQRRLAFTRPAKSGYRLHTLEGAWRTAPAAARVAEYRLAQRKFSRLRRLHADERVREGAGPRHRTCR